MNSKQRRRQRRLLIRQGKPVPDWLRVGGRSENATAFIREKHRTKRTHGIPGTSRSKLKNGGVAA